MSVNLIVVALLAAVVTTVAAGETDSGSDEKAVKITVCGASDAKKCECEQPTVKSYSTTCPEEADETSGLYWKADSCKEEDANFVVKGYRKATCPDENKKTISKTMCQPMVYDMATCDGTTVKLYTGCSLESSDSTCTSCDETATVTFTMEDSCKKWGKKYLKLESEGPTEITFKDHDQDESCMKAAAEEFKVKKACTASRYYGNAVCSTDDNKVTFKSCAAKESDNNCEESDNCESIDVNFNEYKKVGQNYLSIKTCTTSAESFDFDVYADVKQYPKECSEPATPEGYVKAACVAASTSTDDGSGTDDDDDDDEENTDDNGQGSGGSGSGSGQGSGSGSGGSGQGSDGSGQGSGSGQDNDDNDDDDQQNDDAGSDDTSTTTATIKTCPESATECQCEAADENTVKYTGDCAKQKDELYWKVDKCDSDIVVKGYKNSDCAPGKKTVPKTCKGAYRKVTCTGNDVKLYTGCTTATCDGEDPCVNTPITFTLDTPQCTQVGEKTYYTLASTACPTDEETTMTFKQYTDSACKQDMKTVAVPKACTGLFQQATCTPPDASGATPTSGKVSVKTCTNDGCTDGCGASEVPLKKYTVVGDETFYIDSCATTQEEYTFQVYAKVSEYKKGCKGHTEATCGDASNNDNNDNADGGNSSSTTTDSSSTTAESSSTTDPTIEDTNNSSGIDDNGIIAPAHSAGVLAFVLCLLACVY